MKHADQVPQLRVRAVRSGDREQWLRLLYGLYAGSIETDHAPIIDAYFDGSKSRYLLPSVVFVCERTDGGLCGFLELSVRDYAEGCDGPTPYVESWYVDPDVRRTGVGRRLIAAAEHWAVEHGYRELASDAELHNSVSHQAHAATGFVEVERAVHFRKSIS